MRNALPDERKSTGVHYTPNLLAGFVAEQITKSLELHLTDKFRVLDPGAGDGELLLCLVEQLFKNGFTNFDVFGFDTNQAAANLAQARLREKFGNLKISIECKDFLFNILQSYSTGENQTRFSRISPRHYDLIISNPPYVRTQVMGTQKAQLLASQFGLTGRVDLYYAFLLGIAKVLKPGGILGIIVSNRFMTTRSGSFVRQNILKLYDVLHVWDLGDTRLFEAAVLPAVLLLRCKSAQGWAHRSKFTSIYTTKGNDEPLRCSNVIDALSENGVVWTDRGEKFLVRQGFLDHGTSPDGLWRIASGDSDGWLAVVEEHATLTFGQIGNVRVGIKTTADKVFIRSDWGDQKPELLRPLTTHHVARRFKANDPESQVLYTHETVNGRKKAVNLNLFPRSKAYLESHHSTLDRRDYVTKSGRNWYEIWVPQHPDLWEKPKLVWREIAEQPTFWIDLSRTIVNGDCYWLTADDVDLLWLALAVGNSTFIEQFYDHKFHNKLYAGRRRFLTQYVELFPLPNPNTPLAKMIVGIAKQIFELTPSPQAENYEIELDHLVWEVFGLKKSAGK